MLKIINTTLMNVSKWGIAHRLTIYLSSMTPTLSFGNPWYVRSNCAGFVLTKRDFIQIENIVILHMNCRLTILLWVFVYSLG